MSTSNSFENALQSVLDALNDSEIRTIALTGRWGTGKTHLWDRIIRIKYASAAQNARPIYASMFGAKSIEEAKLRLLRGLYLEDKSSFQKIARAGGGVLSAVLRSAWGVAIEDAALLWLPDLLGSRLIVLDDLERKHDDLQIEELLGFIDEYSLQHKVKFLLLLNTDKLHDEQQWAALHEKVLDVEVKLVPSPRDAFEVAAQGFSRPHRSDIGEAVHTLGISNIRVIRKILHRVKRIDRLVDLDRLPPARVIPSIVLLTAIHYRSIDSDITLDYVRRYNAYGTDVTEIAEALNKEHKREKDPREQEWVRVLESLDIRGVDEFEDVVCEYLISGQLDAPRLQRVLLQYALESANAESNARLNGLMDAYRWDPRIEADELVESARALLPEVSKMGPGDVSRIHEMLLHFGEQLLGAQFISSWIDSTRSRHEYKNLTSDAFSYGAVKIHPDIAAHIQALKGLSNPPLTVRQAIKSMEEESGWGNAVRRAFADSTTREYVEALNSLHGPELRDFMSEHLRWKRRGVPDPAFENGLNNFVEACAVVRKTQPGSRIAWIIEREEGGKG